MNSRQLLVKTHGHRYERWNFEGDEGRCFYCDEAPYSRDHVPALTWMDALVNAKQGFRYKCWLVPCCQECNIILGDSPRHTLFERAKHIEKRLVEKYERSHVLWSKQELAQMSRTMQVGIKAKLAKNNILLDRIRAIQLRVLNVASFPEDV